MIYSPCLHPGFSHDPQPLTPARVLPLFTVPAPCHGSPMIYSPCPQPGLSHDLQSLPPARVLPWSTVPDPSQGSPMIHRSQPPARVLPWSTVPAPARVLPWSTVPNPSQGSPIIHNPWPQPGFSHDPQSLPPRQRSPTPIAYDPYCTQGRVARDYVHVLQHINIVGLQGIEGASSRVTTELQINLSLHNFQLCYTDYRPKWPPPFRQHISVSLKRKSPAFLTISPFIIQGYS